MSRAAEVEVIPLILRWAPIPGTAQEEFFDDDTPEGKLLFTGGYGSGKTTTLVAKCLKLSAINYPLPGIFTVPDFGHVEDTIIPALTELDPSNNQPWFLDTSQFHYSLRTHVLEWEGGGAWHFQSGKYALSIKGPQRAWGAMDEPGIQSYEAWRNTVNRVRHPGARLRQMICAGTPEGLNWLADQFTQDDRTNYKLYRMKTEQNVELLKWQPDYIKQVMENATEAELRSYLGGEIVNLVGAMAYPTFSRTIHWTEEVPGAIPDLPLRICFDFNVDPMACVIVQIVGGIYGNEVIVPDAIIKSASWTPEICEEIINRYGRSACLDAGLGERGWPGGVIIYGDATGGYRSTLSLQSNYDIIKNMLAPEFPSFSIHPSVLKKVNPPETSRVNAVNVLLKNALGHVRLHIRKTAPAQLCTTAGLVSSFERTIKAPGTNQIWKGGHDTTTHATDALGYLIATEFPVTMPRKFGTGNFGRADL